MVSPTSRIGWNGLPPRSLSCSIPHPREESFYHVPLGATQLAIVAFAAVFLAAAGPGVPRGAFILLAPLFTAIGLPVEGLGILIAVDAIPDTFATVLNVTGDLAAAAIVNRSTPARAAKSAHSGK